MTKDLPTYREISKQKMPHSFYGEISKAASKVDMFRAWAESEENWFDVWAEVYDQILAEKLMEWGFIK